MAVHVAAARAARPVLPRESAGTHWLMYHQVDKRAREAPRLLRESKIGHVAARASRS